MTTKWFSACRVARLAIRWKAVRRLRPVVAVVAGGLYVALQTLSSQASAATILYPNGGKRGSHPASQSGSTYHPASSRPRPVPQPPAGGTRYPRPPHGTTTTYPGRQPPPSRPGKGYPTGGHPVPPGRGTPVVYEPPRRYYPVHGHPVVIVTAPSVVSSPAPARHGRHHAPVLAVATPSVPTPPRQSVAPSRPAASLDRSYVPDEVLIEWQPRASGRATAGVVRRAGLQSIDAVTIGLLDTTIARYRVRAGRDPAAVVAALSGDRRVASVQLNGKFQLQEIKPQLRPPAPPADTGSGPAAPAVDPAPAPDAAASPAPGADAAASETDAQWSAVKMQLRDAHLLSNGDNILIAVIDSGVELTHPELSGGQVRVLNVLPSTFAAHDHGTAMVGALMAHAQLMGVAPHARIMAIRTFDAGAVEAGAEGTTTYILKGLDEAARAHANIINLSFAGPADALMSRMLAKLKQTGIVVVAAAGNAGPGSPPLYPGADPSVIAVTATDASDDLYPLANRGPYISVGAPGVEVLEPAVGGSYQLTSGTSVAASHVSGLVALMLAHTPGLSPDAIRRALIETADHDGPAAKSGNGGAGVVDVVKALQDDEAAKGSQLAPASKAGVGTTGGS